MNSVKVLLHLSLWSFQASCSINSETHDYSAGSSFSDCSGCPELVVIPAGEFIFGIPADLAVKAFHRRRFPAERRVIIPAAFAIGKFEITYSQFLACYQEGLCANEPVAPPALDGEYSNLPLVQTSWNEAQEYAAWLSNKTGQRYRLPSEAEWEYAAKANTTTLFWWGDEIGVGNAKCDFCLGENNPRPREPDPVGSYPANPFGLHDMLGNVREWVQDCFVRGNGIPVTSTSAASYEPEICESRVSKGSSYQTPSKAALRPYHRGGGDPEIRFFKRSFRLVRELD